MNTADSDSIAGMLDDFGFEKSTEEKADIVLYNTCAVREKAEQRMRSELGSVRIRKESNPEVKIGILGCAAESLKEKLEKEEWIDIVQDGKNLEKMKEAVMKILPDEYETTQDSFGLHRSGENSGMIPVIRGCSYMCSYCIVPRTRGLQRSIPLKEILKDVELSIEKGSKEIYLLGQNFLSYGRDLSKKTSPEEMISTVHDSFPELKRIRFLTSHPHDLTKNFLQTMNSLPRVARYLHLPFQSGSDTVLKAMRRITTRQTVIEKSQWVREIWKDATLSTDIIVGFPTETEKDHKETISLLEEVQYDFAYSFLYSPRPQTKAFPLGDPIPHKEKVKRLSEVTKVLNSIWFEKNKKYLGKTVEVLVENKEGKSENRWTGRSEGFHLVHFDSNTNPIGKYVKVKITKTGSTFLGGELV
tara:strand:- start:27369 stop:28613 length:1245 start_codon:yes stop_codon:yes gene_type:complete